jgi:hypothetical protein
MRVFEGNFKGTYMRPGNSWDLQSWKQKSGESLRDYIRRFSKQRTELPNITDSDIIMAFLSGTTCKELVRELGRNTPHHCQRFDGYHHQLRRRRGGGWCHLWW